MWDLGGNTKDLASLDYTKDKSTDGMPGHNEIQPDTRVKLYHMVCLMLSRYTGLVSGTCAHMDIH